MVTTPDQLARLQQAESPPTSPLTALEHHPNPWVDISLTLHPGMPHWPDNPALSLEPSHCLAHGDICNVSKLTIGTHTGTHIDGLRHFIKNDIGIDQMPLDATLGRARVIEICDRESIKVPELAPHNLQAGERILFKTINSSEHLQADHFVEDFVYISTEAACYLADRQVCTVGVDYLSIGGYEKNVVDVHHALLGNGIWVIEGLDLSQIQPGDYELICACLSSLKMAMVGWRGQCCGRLSRSPIKVRQDQSLTVARQYRKAARVKLDPGSFDAGRLSKQGLLKKSDPAKYGLKPS